MSRQKPEPDCYTCIRWDECENAARIRARTADASVSRTAHEIGYFCPQWQSKHPEPKGEDPNEAWERGEEVEF